MRGFLDAIERVAAGGTALDRAVVAELVHARDGGSGAFAELTPREREVMELMAEGKTNAAIARAMVVQPGAVEKHVSSIFSKLDLPASRRRPPSRARRARVLAERVTTAPTLRKQYRLLPDASPPRLPAS